MLSLKRVLVSDFFKGQDKSFGLLIILSNDVYPFIFIHFDIEYD